MTHLRTATAIALARIFAALRNVRTTRRSDFAFVA